MSDIAIHVDNLSKRYRIGLNQERHDTFVSVVAGLFARPIKNLRRLRRLSRFSETDNEAPDIVWALKKVSFEINRGEVVGIIGRNGAGKTTLLKILARITEPTEGQARIDGRVGSLLEVGTGFHPELTGRDNVYLNGAVLGMTRKEIKRKFDEIVDFAEVERFIDTPVKRYSTGMLVRLAFSVAAHLEPDILLVDEVLAVGDVAFQRKCLEKMNAAARGGRTTLFVSHNMGTIARLCTRVLWVDAGQIALTGPSHEVIRAYLASEGSNSLVWIHSPKSCNVPELRLISARVVFKDDQPTSIVDFNAPFKVAIEYEITSPTRSLCTGYELSDLEGNIIWTSVEIDNMDFSNHVRGCGRYLSTCTIPGNLIKPGRYLLSVGCADGIVSTPCRHENVLTFDVSEVGCDLLRLDRLGIVTPSLDWEVKRIDAPVPVPVPSEE